MVGALLTFGETELAEELYREAKSFAELTNIHVKTLQQIDIEKNNPELEQVYPQLKNTVKTQKEIDGFFGKFEFLLK